MAGNVDFGRLQRYAKEMQKQMQELETELKEIVVEGTAGGGMVSVKANALGEVLAVEVKPEVVVPDDKAMLEDLVTAAVNDALKKARKVKEEEQARIMGGGANLMDMMGGA